MVGRSFFIAERVVYIQVFLGKITVSGRWIGLDHMYKSFVTQTKRGQPALADRRHDHTSDVYPINDRNRRGRSSSARSKGLLGR